MKTLLMPACIALLAACSNPAPQVSGEYHDPHNLVAVRFLTTSTAEVALNNYSPRVANYTRSGDDLTFTAEGWPRPNFVFHATIKDGGKFIHIGDMRAPNGHSGNLNLDLGKTLTN
ncbi:MAG: hypothetical protein BGP10_14555 [Rhodanobacter sp. 68-29]|nr:hypothetical protein [Rhodanobacter sp.]ODU72722.1 MAG: hypothetical protein ABT17_15220 [Rhodanobacter sp. SCN 69-32]OJY61156.1 MAG: hypothetical protein BGP10_14555 [Rhodanobacter sp. 68-29]